MAERTKPYTIDEAAEHLQLSTRTVRRYIADGKLEAKRIGKRAIRIKASSVANIGNPIGGAAWQND